jgi:excisionase family DNA binding protein
LSTLIEKLRAEYYTLGDAAKAAGVSRVTLWRWIKSGKLTAARMGREVLVEKRAIEAMIQNYG